MFSTVFISICFGNGCSVGIKTRGFMKEVGFEARARRSNVDGTPSEKVNKCYCI